MEYIGIGVRRAVVRAFSDEYYKLAKAVYFSSVHLLLSYGILALLFYLILKYVENRSLASLGFTGVDKPAKPFFRGFYLGLKLMTGIWLVLVFMGHNTALATHKISVNGPAVLIMLIGWTLMAATWEAISRGYLQQKVGQQFGFRAGLAANIGVYALSHFLIWHFSWLSLVNILLVGVMFTVYAQKEQNLIGVTGFHAAWLFAQANFYGFMFGHQFIPGGTLVRSTLDHSIWAGGKFGPENGLIYTIVVLGTIWWIKKYK
jgi:membrane protease YdiL (CAAX protease family)